MTAPGGTCPDPSARLAPRPAELARASARRRPGGRPGERSHLGRSPGRGAAPRWGVPTTPRPPDGAGGAAARCPESRGLRAGRERRRRSGLPLPPQRVLRAGGRRRAGAARARSDRRGALLAGPTARRGRTGLRPDARRRARPRAERAARPDGAKLAPSIRAWPWHAARPRRAAPGAEQLEDPERRCACAWRRRSRPWATMRRHQPGPDARADRAEAAETGTAPADPWRLTPARTRARPHPGQGTARARRPPRSRRSARSPTSRTRRCGSG